MRTANIDCIIVTYKPDMVLFQNVLNSIVSQVRHCYIINNGAASFSFNIKNVTVIDLNKNYGIAYAQNRGIELAKQNNAGCILLSDQDTVYPSEYIANMMTACELYPEKSKIGALVPRVFDKNKMRKTEIAITKFKYITPDEDTIYTVSHAVSSGTIIPVESLNAIGNMREELFIDWVDFEWCCRATKLGYNIISVPGVSIYHFMGDGVKRIGNRKIALRSSVRYYYIIRNGVYIIRYTDVLTMVEKILFGRELFVKMIGICLIEKQALPLLFKAFYDGITKRMYEIADFGKYQK